MNLNMNQNIQCSNPNNGRVNIMGNQANNPFFMSDRIPIDDCTSYKDAMTGNWVDTPLSTAFFSRENIQILQNGIRAGVHKMSKGQYTVGPQDCDVLKIVMRSTFLQYAANKPQDIANQISALNKIVLDYSVKQVYGEAQGYIKYKEDVSQIAPPIALPVQPEYNNKIVFL